MGLSGPEKFSGDTQRTRMRTLNGSRTGQYLRKQSPQDQTWTLSGQAEAQRLSKSNRVGSQQCSASGAHTG